MKNIVLIHLQKIVFRKKKMLTWNIKQANNIPSNPLECYWAVGYVNAFPRIYTIVEQYPSIDGYTIDSRNFKPELYVLFENTHVRRISDVMTTESEVKEWKHASIYGDFWVNGNGGFVRAFKTLEEAKARAEVNLKVIQSISKSLS